MVRKRELGMSSLLNISNHNLGMAESKVHKRNLGSCPSRKTYRRRRDLWEFGTASASFIFIIAEINEICQESSYFVRLGDACTVWICPPRSGISFSFSWQAFAYVPPAHASLLDTCGPFTGPPTEAIATPTASTEPRRFRALSQSLMQAFFPFRTMRSLIRPMANIFTPPHMSATSRQWTSSVGSLPFPDYWILHRRGHVLQTQRNSRVLAKLHLPGRRSTALVRAGPTSRVLVAPHASGMASNRLMLYRNKWRDRAMVRSSRRSFPRCRHCIDVAALLQCPTHRSGRRFFVSFLTFALELG